MLNLFKVGVTVALIDRVSGSLATVGSALDRAHKHTTAYQAAMQKVQTQMDRLHAVKAVGETAFRASAGAIDAMLDPAKEYTSQIVRMNMAGLEHQTIAKNVAAAWETTGSVITTTATDNLRTLSELYGVITEKGGSMTEARDLLPRFQEMKMVLMASTEMPAEEIKTDGLAYDAVKAAEMVGKTSKDDIIHMADMMEKVMIASGGKITPTDYQSFFKYARAAKLTLSEDELFNVVPELMIEMKGRSGSGGAGGPGTMYASMFSTMVQGTMSKATAGHLQELGLMNGPMMDTTTTGTVVEGMKWRDLIGSDPSKWVEEKLVPAILAKKPEIEGNEAAMALEIARIIKGPRLTTALIQELHNKESKGIIDKFHENKDRVLDHASLVEEAKGSPRVLDVAFAAQWQNLLTVLGTEIIPYFTPLIASLASGFHNLAGFLKEHKGITQLLVFMTAMGVVIGGIVAVLAPLALVAAPLLIAGATIGEIAIAAAAGAIAMGALFLSFKFWQGQLDNFGKVLDNVGKQWTTFVGFLSEGLATFIEQGAIFVAGFVSKFDPQKGAEIATGGLEVGENIRKFGVPKAPEVYGPEVPNAPWYNGQPDNPAFHSNEVKMGDVHFHKLDGESAEQMFERFKKWFMEDVLLSLSTSAAGGGVSSSPYQSGG